MERSQVHIGTSGWSYVHWDELFYHGLQSEEWLSFYAQHFSTVEINSTFYHLPKESTVKKWVSKTPKDFIFSVKASRYITHIKRLKDSKEGIKRFLETLAPLKRKLGPLLFQLPASANLNYDRLEECLSQLPKGYLYTFEFRNDGWFIDEIYSLLEKYNIALCISDLAGKTTPIKVTAEFVYIRLHGPKKAYQGIYSHRKLKEWAARIEEWKKKKLSVFVYFDNDQKGYAIKDAIKLNKLLFK